MEVRLKPSYSFDATDKSILRLIQEDSRITIKEMAQKLNLSTTPVFERLKRLERNKVVLKYVAILDPKKLGQKLKAYVHISISDHNKKGLESFVERITRYHEVLECVHVSGDSDFILRVVVEDMEAYNLFVAEKLSAVPNIARVRTSFCLSEKKNTQAFHIP